VLTVVLTLWVAAFPAAAQPSEPLDRIERVGRWVDVALHHEPGTWDDPAAEVGSWSNSDLQVLWIDLSTLAELLHRPTATYFAIFNPNHTKKEPIRYTPEEFRRLKTIAEFARRSSDADTPLRRGALLHTDIAMNRAQDLQPLGRPRESVPQRMTVHIGDGQPLDMGATAIHSDTARMLIERTPRDNFARAWYRATSSWMQQHEDHDMDHVDRALKLFPSDPDILFLYGCMHEVLASAKIQSLVQALRLPSGFQMNFGTARAELRLAENALRQAAARKPDWAEARLHYGRVLDLLGDHRAAIVEFSHAAGSLDDEELEISLTYSAVLRWRARTETRRLVRRSSRRRTASRRRSPRRSR